MSSYSSTITSSTADQGGGTAISAVHPDIIQTHILTRLDGQTLFSAGCASSQLRTLCTEEKLWTEICNSTWPSTNDPRVRDTISTFPSGHRSFFSDSYPSFDHRPSQKNHNRPSPPSELISAVDIHYQNKLIFSKVEVTETVTEWFFGSPFRVDLLDPKEIVPTLVKFEGGSNLKQHMTLSWVVVDPTRKRAVNLSSLRPVSVRRHWLTDDVQVRYSTIMPGDVRVGSSELIQCSCSVVVTCGGEEGGELHVREVSLQLEDMDGKSLSGEDSLVILQEVMESGRRKKGKRGEERERHEEYMEMRRERRERKQRRETRLDMMFIATGVTIFMAFWALIYANMRKYSYT